VQLPTSAAEMLIGNALRESATSAASREMGRERCTDFGAHVGADRARKARELQERPPAGTRVHR
jgi:hypothetical protein